jgi:hypothetical protein
MNLMNTLTQLRLCVDCVQYDADPSYEYGDTKPLAKLRGWLLSSVYDGEGNTEPHFSWGACDGCDTTLGGDRYDYTGVTLPRIGNGGAYTVDEMRLDDSGRWVDPKGGYGYTPRLGGSWVCYTCGHMCECGDDDE